MTQDEVRLRVKVSDDRVDESPFWITVSREAHDEYVRDEWNEEVEDEVLNYLRAGLDDDELDELRGGLDYEVIEVEG